MQHSQGLQAAAGAAGHKDDAGLAPAVAVGSGIKRLAAPVAGQRAQLRQVGGGVIGSGGEDKGGFLPQEIYCRTQEGVGV